ncbi:hypothetical protein WJX81_004763 [Elliptochloris bilobata]|uniref:Mitogen-activated protein kinase kinase kinase 1 n=1 Tax=Elliptochloris bilobata TaxID=381761 RepID=A0AAW1RV10_9CHLO
MERALPGSGHRIFLISREKQSADKETFTVLGAKADVYTVVIGRQPSCNCPDSRIRRNICKHHMFVMLRCLGLSPNDPRVWQRALTQVEAEQILGGAEQALGGVLADDAVRRAYLELMGKPVGGLKAAAAPVKQRPLDSDACPICFDQLSKKESVIFCTTCGNNVHAQCFDMWTSQRQKQGADPVCVFCRAPWPVNKPEGRAKKGKGRAASRPTDIVNLLGASQAHQSANLTQRALYGNGRRYEEEYYEGSDGNYE